MKQSERPNWIVAATRIVWLTGSPFAIRSETCRESSCSTGQQRAEMVMKTADQSSVIWP